MAPTDFRKITLLREAGDPLFFRSKLIREIPPARALRANHSLGFGVLSALFIGATCHGRI